MTEDQNCDRCGKRLRLNRAGTITQWLKTTGECSCDSQDTFPSPFPSGVPDDRQALRCPACGKERGDERGGSLTQWIFKENKCKCDWSQLEIVVDTKQSTASYKAEPIDEEIKQILAREEIDYHGLEPDSFPFERYRIISEIGRGSGGIVYKCWDTFLSKRVAIKTLRAEKWQPEDMLRLQNEARAASKLSHPNLVRVLDFGAAESGQPFMVMDFASGTTLENILKEGSLDQQSALPIFAQVLSGISHAHRNGILHRDLKPSNILIANPSSDAPQAQIIDFGIASLTQAASVQTTASGKTVITGSPSYMSPDQARGEPFDERSDIYSIGCIFYEALTGVNPFFAPTVLETISRHALLVPPPFAEVSPDSHVDSELEEVVMRMLAKTAFERYQSVDEIAEQIGAIMERLCATKSAPLLKRKIDQTGVLVTTSVPRRGADQTLLVIVTATALFVVSISFIILQKTGTIPSPKSQKAETTVEEKVVGLDDEISKPSYFEEVMLPNSSKGDAYVRDLKQQGNLRVVNLRMSEVTNNGVKELENLPVEELDLSYTEVSDAAIQSIVTLKKLTHLSLIGTNITAHGIGMLSKLQSLEFLDLSAMPTSQNTLQNVAKIPNLKKLYLISVPKITAETLKPLARAPKLQVLSLRRTKLGYGEMEELSKFPRLEWLLVSNSSLKDEDLVFVKNMAELKLLDIAGNAISDAGLRNIGTNKKLKELYIAHCRGITRDGIMKFKKVNRNCDVRLEFGPTALGTGQE